MKNNLSKSPVVNRKGEKRIKPAILKNVLSMYSFEKCHFNVQNGALESRVKGIFRKNRNVF